MQKSHLLVVTMAIVIGAAAFYGGMHYQLKKTTGRFDRMGGGQYAGQMRNGSSQGQDGGQNKESGMMGMRPISGEIISQDDKSLTIKMSDGSSKIVILSEKTTINKTSEANKADLKTNEQVTIFGISNPDGSITAQNVALGNMMFRGIPKPSGEAIPSTSPTPTAK